MRLRALAEEAQLARTCCDGLDTRLMRVEAASVEAKLKDARARDALEALESRRLDHRRFRPGLIEILLTFGRAFREWRTKDATLVSKIEAVEHRLALATGELSEKTDEWVACQRASRNARGRLEALTDELANVTADQTRAATALGIDVPDPDTHEWRDDNTRELSAPWADEAWNASRQHVFVAALALHRAFLCANAARMQQILHAAMDLLDGSVPDEAPDEAVADAWRALFFVVPVVSTTFASFARLFPQLGPESLGWVLVDEAGQAPPQEAVGAFWRARRAVVVGDPLQLEPIVTIKLKAQEALRRHYDVNGLWTPGRTSVQHLADRVALRGTYVVNGERSVWVGSPLRVHRRCDAPMVDICNAIAYGDMMVNGTSARASVPLNVAVSRAKRRLYVIGDLSAWRRCIHFSTCAMLLERNVEREVAERTETES